MFYAQQYENVVTITSYNIYTNNIQQKETIYKCIHTYIQTNYIYNTQNDSKINDNTYGSSIHLAKPKSASLTLKFPSNKIFELFKSLCT